MFGKSIFEDVYIKINKKNFEKPVIEMIDYYYNNLLYWQNNTDKLDLDWAYFL